jgi:hypothetical protein
VQSGVLSLGRLVSERTQQLWASERENVADDRGELEPRGGNPLERSIQEALEKAVSLQQSSVRNYVRRQRRAHPDATPKAIIKKLETKYLVIASTSGGSVGAIAVIPAVGTAPALALSAAETLVFLEATALFTLAVAEVHGLPVYDLDRRRTVLMTVLLGKSGTEVIKKAAPRTSKHWAKAITASIPAQSIRSVNKVLGHNFVTKYGTRQGILVIGRALPMGIGAVIGGTAGAFMSSGVMKAIEIAYGKPPLDWPSESPSPDDPDE